MTYYVYEYVEVNRNRTNLKAIVHVASCPSCNHGEGHPSNAGRRHGLWQWHGPFVTFEEAQDLAQQISGAALLCKRCHPHPTSEAA